MKIAIAGAGIAGLTAALALRRTGHRVTICERTTTISPGGAGIVLAPNAIRILCDLGVDLSACGHPVSSLTVVTSRGERLQSIDVDRILPGAGPALAFHRQELHQALVAALPHDVELQLGAAFDDRSSLDQELLIGADGIRSTVRTRILGQVPLLYSGTTCWRAVVENAGVDKGFEAWGGAARVGAVPLTRGRLYVYLVLAAPPGIPRQTTVGAIKPHFQQFAEPLPRILDALEGTELLHHDLEELAAPVWGRDRIVLIGDAAHAMTPNLGQGAGMCIEDAAVLPAIVAAPSPARALMTLRHERVARIQKESRRLGQIAHWKSPAAVGLRNALLRHMPASISDGNYRRMIEPGLNLLRDSIAIPE